ncbi:hypothetical protein KUTeg_022489 [Tegillarca granosa]|uniref:Sushi, nidogen and EGF-like domain-containing protein 1 n=1 Tax=Tegillarca granosa TaxID=220873 RepID=A0ABQ9EBT9_TEGGR|nr:hypothetical protein KUTeg_022489 [Tegillarca granosa]
MCSNVRLYSGFSIHIIIIYCLIINQFSFGITISDLYPYGSQNGDRETARLDDGGSGRIDLNSTFKFFGRNYNKLFVNNNGIITFDSKLQEYKPQSFPPATESENRPIIAPFWADVDIQRIPNGSVYYRQTINATLLKRASEEIRNYFISQRLFTATWMFVVTWEDVGFYGASKPHGKTKKNTFQAILVTNGKRSFVIFNYLKIVWTTGSNSQGNTQTGLGGKQAQAGFNAGDGENYYSIEGAQTAAVVNFTITSNVGVPGKWVFRVDGKSVEDVKCHHAVQIKLHPQAASMLGGQEIRVSGPCFSMDFSVYARIYETNITFPCTVQNDVSVSCVTPTIFRTGEVTFQLNPYNLGWNYSSVFTLINIEDMVPKINVDINNHVTWDPVDIPSNDSKLELFQYMVNAGGQPSLTSVWNHNLIHGHSASNISIPSNVMSGSTALLRISWNSTEDTDSLPLSIWSRPFPVHVDRDYSKQWCKKWTDLENLKENLTDSFNFCPCTLNQALWDTGRFHTDSFCKIGKDKYSNCLYRRGASHCVQQNIRSSTTTGASCCYDKSGELIDIRSQNGGGSRSRYHYRTQGKQIVPYFSYFEDDTLPYFHCCQNSEDRNLCLLYSKYRPPTTCQLYNPPTPAQAAGDPHITTLDGRDYTFNGVGDFVLVQDLNSTVVIQVRTEQAKDTNGVTQNASVFTGVAMAALGFSDIVEVHRPEEDSDAGVSIIVNGKQFVMDSSSVTLNGITLNKEEVNSTLTIRMVMESTPLSVSVDVLPDLLNLVVMSGDDSMRGELRGLLGDFDGNKTNDFLPRNGTHMPSDASMEVIHYGFGMTLIRCPFLEAPENGNRSVSGYLPGDNATIMCDEGFVMIQGNSIRYCTVNGSWTGTASICAKPIGM